MKKLGMIGIGNMGGAIVYGLLKKNVLPPDMITVSDNDSERVKALSSELGICVSTSNSALVEESEVIILAIKPHIVPTVLSDIKNKLSKSKLLISIALGVTLDGLSKMTDDRVRLMRCLPNTPALVNAGMTCVATCPETEEGDKEIVQKLFGAIGEVEFMPEELLGKMTPLTSSSPAYVFMFLEAMGDAAVQSGVPRKMAYRLAAQSVLGAAKMSLEANKHPGELKDMVCSPSGSTIEAVRYLEKNGFRSVVIEAMIESDIKAEYISKMSSDA
ncbi:MAG: pyrroline-5-carboxylate reductase [Oscillospiraceae bacterium]|nr:pyrroline-5-carboxylate reductase [Oscillospiraceae bacterium]